MLASQPPLLSPESSPHHSHCSPLAAWEVSNCLVVEAVWLSPPLCLQSVGWYLAPAPRILELEKHAAQGWWASPWGWRTRGLWTCPNLRDDGHVRKHIQPPGVKEATRMRTDVPRQHPALILIHVNEATLDLPGQRILRQLYE